MIMEKNGLKMGIIMVIIFALGIFLGYYFGGANTGVEISDVMNGGEMTDNTNDGSVTESVPEEGITVDSAALSDGQKKMLGALGVDVENIVITPEMVACAEAKVGSARLIEIQNGDSPSVIEGASLAACYK